MSKIRLLVWKNTSEGGWIGVSNKRRKSIQLVLNGHVTREENAFSRWEHRSIQLQPYKNQFSVSFNVGPGAVDSSFSLLSINKGRWLKEAYTTKSKIKV